MLPDRHPFDNRIQCLLLETPLNHAGNRAISYEALSYTWGEIDSHGYKIWLNGKHFAVRKNLLCALRVLQASTQYLGSRAPWETKALEGFGSQSTSLRTSWIDAICS